MTSRFFTRLMLLTFVLALAACGGGSEQPEEPEQQVEPTQQATVENTDRCPIIVETALTAVDVNCEGAALNTVCYGNVMLSAQPKTGDAILLNAPGDTAAMAEVASLRLEPLNTERDIWGIAMMRLQANMRDTLPGQAVVFLLFGDVELENRSDDESPNAFYFRSGIGDAPCAEAPDSGILVQTPEGVKEVEMAFNGVDIVLSSTAYLQAQPNADMSVSLIEGQAKVTTQNVTQTVQAGNRTTIALDDQGNAAAPPTEPEPFVAAEIATVPVQSLERPVTVSDVMFGAQFDQDLEGWSIYQDGTNLTHFPADETSDDGYFCADDQGTGVYWYFQAPDAWIGDRSDAYGGALNFVLKQSATDSQMDQPDVIMAGGPEDNPITLYFDTAENPGTDWTAYSVPLVETAGWVIADEDRAPTAEEMRTVLGSLITVRIRGEYRSGADTGCMSGAQWLAPVHAGG